MSTSVKDSAIKIFKQHDGMLRTSEAIGLGIHPQTLYALRDAGVIEQLSRGLYRLAQLRPLTNPDLVIVTARVPQAVICLISALAFYELTTQIPHVVDVALAPHTRRPSLDYPPVRAFFFSRESLTAGIDRHVLDGTPVKIYNPAKTIADVFKYRRKIGLDVAVEALKLYRRRRGFNVNDLLKYARIDRVEKVMRPYIETVQ